MHITETRDKRILYAALDWGFGHVTRSIGIIRQLERQGNTVIIACNKEQKQLFVSYFPELIYEALDGYNLRFSGKGNWAWDLLKQRGRFLGAVRNEEKLARDLCYKHDIELVVSDHRYGFRAEEVPSVFVTHQLHLPIPKLAFFVQRWHEKQLQKFTSLWVLDDKNSSLAGKLSRPLGHPDLNYIGWYSRFERSELTSLDTSVVEDSKITFAVNAEGSLLTQNPNKFDYLVVLSGPEPYSLHLLDEISRKIDFKDKNENITSVTLMD